jgi:hypothetical protein
MWRRVVWWWGSNSSSIFKVVEGCSPKYLLSTYQDTRHHILEGGAPQRWWIQQNLHMRSTLFWDITRRHVVIVYRRFGTTYPSHLQGSGVISQKNQQSRKFEVKGTEVISNNRKALTTQITTIQNTCLHIYIYIYMIHTQGRIKRRASRVAARVANL